MKPVSVDGTMKSKVYIDGEVGTTGLRIRQWLGARDDLELLRVPEAQRKDPDARRARMLAADVSVLCLPDEAAREAAAWVVGTRARLIDTSTAHRVAPNWVYGLPELGAGQRQAIRHAQLVSSPGCYSSAFILLTRPLIDCGLLSADVAPSVHALSGYSGGGRSLIQRWENPELRLATLPYEAPYAYTRVHKHIAEMMQFSGLRVEPQFLPAVGPFACGMRVQVALPATSLPPGANATAIWQALHERYANEKFVRVASLATPAEPDERAFDPRRCNDTNRIELHVVAHPSGHVVLIGILDNLGKGAAGVAIQSLNLMLGLPEATGLPA
jgi:N-acetyl-gamma-glutamyl-phosphate reductase